MNNKIFLLTLLLNITFAVEVVRPVELYPGVNEIAVKIVNECDKTINGIHLLITTGDIPDGMYISINSPVVTSLKGETTSVPVIINVTGDVKEDIYNLALTLKDDRNHTWNYSLSLNVLKAKIKDYNLDQNYPNPFNPETTIRYSIVHEKEIVKLDIFDLLGRKIRTLVNGTQNTGIYSVNWDGKNDNNIPVSSGIYIYQLKAGSFAETKRMILMK